MKKKLKATEAAQTNIEGVNKDTHFLSQYQVVYTSFMQQPKTMLDVSLETGILRANICRYVAEMEDKGIIRLIRKGEDIHTKATAGYYTTNKELFPKLELDRQLDFWKEVKDCI